MKCQLCDGTGRLIKPWYDTTGLMTGFTGDICFMCDGTGEIAEETAKKTTNFDLITASPEALAEFIYCLIEACDYAAGNGAKKISQYANEDANDKRHIELIHGNRDFDELLEWLNGEYKE